MSSSTFPQSSLAAYSLTVPNTTRSSKYKEHFQLFYVSGTAPRNRPVLELVIQILALLLTHSCHLLTGSEVPPVQQQDCTAVVPKSPPFPPRPLSALERTVSSAATTQLKNLCFRWYLQPQHCSQKIKESTSIWAVISGVPEGTCHHLTDPNTGHGYKSKSI